MGDLQAETHGPFDCDWAGLHSPLLQRCFLLSLGKQTLHFAKYLREDTAEGAACREEQATLAALACVCRRWRAEVAHLLEHEVTWSVTVNRWPHETFELLKDLECTAAAELDLRWLSWQFLGDPTFASCLLGSDAFQRSSAACLRAALGISECLVPRLAAFGNLDCVGLMEDHVSTACKAHGLPMQLAPLHCLHHLRRLHLEYGIVDLAALPPQVQQLTLVEIDRLVVPPAPGASVADRLLAVAEAQGLHLLSLTAASGCVVFEEADQAPLELELGHTARLLETACASSSKRWRVALSMCREAGEMWQCAQHRLELSRTA